MALFIFVFCMTTLLQLGVITLSKMTSAPPSANQIEVFLFGLLSLTSSGVICVDPYLMCFPLQVYIIRVHCIVPLLLAYWENYPRPLPLDESKSFTYLRCTLSCTEGLPVSRQWHLNPVAGQ